MNSGPRHARKKESRRAQAILRVGLTVSAAGAAVAGAGGMAAAAGPGQVDTPVGSLDTSALQDPAEGLGEGLQHGAAGAVGTATGLQLDPLAGTGSDPLANGVGTQVADFKPVGTQAVTGPLSEGASLGELPIVERLPGVPPG